jgi:two-component system, NtrC family, sensor histidine kinase HydH
MRVAPKDILEEVAGYIDFGDEDAQLLSDVGPLVGPRIPAIAEAFYDAIQKSLGASAAITGGNAQVERLKGTLRQWLEGVVGGTYDADYLAQRSRIGRVHVKVGLDQRYMFSAMNLLREGLHRAFHDALETGGAAAAWPPERRRLAHRAINRICDIELAIMLESYREDYVARIRTTERLATLGQLAASIGHELRNPLAVVETSVHLLGRQLQEHPRAERHIKRIAQQVTVCGTIISDLLEMARDRPPHRQPTSVPDLVREAVGAVPGTDGVRMEMELAPNLPVARLDAGQMRQLIINLVLNAVQAVQGVDGPPAVVRIALGAEGQDLHLRVTDSGPGLTAEAQKRLFEPLFTTRSKGIGLGLALCRRIVEKHEGTIIGRNEDRGGALFHVVLPGALATETP